MPKECEIKDDEIDCGAGNFIIDSTMENSETNYYDDVPFPDKPGTRMVVIGFMVHCKGK